MITWGREYWPAFLTVTSLSFAIPELIALFTNVKNTLSDYSWAELGIVNNHIPVHSVAWIISLTAWVLFVFIITAHIWFGQRF